MTARSTGRWTIWVITTNRRNINAAFRTAYGLDRRPPRRRMRRLRLLPPSRGSR
ncbi:hypothetical protein QWY28_13350 [Nocardioides sp. SOB77]|uniref:Uncharacterized protein n=1 Tax=Nocardioides oceani TaxID=3058369 RepID=A0ABT8FGW9_9ACTN|nr:hypothetical protein [Nocardioides oceani]MDN4173941.1 hypothetical protein [Nocardioides oceani]